MNEQEEAIRKMSLAGFNPGYHLERSELYKNKRKGKRPAAAQSLIDQERAIVERNQREAALLAEQEKNDEGTVS